MTPAPPGASIEQRASELDAAATIADKHDDLVFAKELRQQATALRRTCAMCTRGANTHSWECSHVECPNRLKVTAAPCDRPPPIREERR